MGKAEPHDVRLQRYFDGELSPAERAEVEAALTDDDRLKLAALGEVRGLVANTLSAEAAEVDLWPALEKQLGAGQGDVVSLETSGSIATVFDLSDTPHKGDASTTVIWTEEED